MLLLLGTWPISVISLMVGLVFLLASPFLISGTHMIAGDVRSPPPLLLLLLLLSRLCEDQALSRTQQARYAVV